VSSNPIAVVCVTAFVVGGAAAGILFRPSSHADGPGRGDAVGVVQAAQAGDGENASADNPVTNTDAEESAGVVEVGNAVGDPARDVVRSAGGAKARAVTNAHSGGGTTMAGGYAKVSTVRKPSAGRGVAGPAVGGVKKAGEGVKKTGQVVGRTFGKLSGVFHD
jgi:hypothetical protein